MSNLEFMDGEKYGLIVFSNIRVDDALPTELQVAPDLWVTRSLPVGLDSHWRKWLGTIQAERIEKADLFLIAKGASQNPEILDEDNQKYKKRVHHFYWGLLLSDFFQIFDTPLQLTGAKRRAELEVCSIMEMDKSPGIPGTPNPPIHPLRLAQAVKLADAASSLEGKKKHKRFWKILRGFYDGLTSNAEEDRLHQFIRCIEGFILPGIGKTESHFKSRTELFIGARHHPLIEQLYKLRSAVEHLHDPLLSVPGASPGDKLVTLFRKSYEAEALARYCIERFVSRQDLWPHFEDDPALEQFWSLSPSDRENLWGDKLDIDQVSKAFIERGARIAIKDMNLPLP